MKKIPTAFKREFEGHKIIGVLDEFTNDECKEAFLHGVPTVKFDGSCCAIIDGKFYKRYDAKKGKKIPENAIKCQEEPDPVTGHLPCWVPVDYNDPADKWFVAAMETSMNDISVQEDGTFEAIGKHFQGNPYNSTYDCLVRHGAIESSYIHEPVRSLETVKKFLENTIVEGIVFWMDGEPVCKIKRTDFGFAWPVKKR